MFEGPHIFAVPSRLLRKPVRESRKIRNAHKGLVAATKAFSKRKEINPFEVGFPELVDRVIQVEPVHIGNYAAQRKNP